MWISTISRCKRGSYYLFLKGKKSSWTKYFCFFGENNCGWKKCRFLVDGCCQTRDYRCPHAPHRAPHRGTSGNTCKDVCCANICPHYCFFSFLSAEISGHLWSSFSHCVSLLIRLRERGRLTRQDLPRLQWVLKYLSWVQQFFMMSWVWVQRFVVLKLNSRTGA